MDHLFFSWLATQSYSVEVAIGTIFVVIIAPAVLAGMAFARDLGGTADRGTIAHERAVESVERGKKNLWRLHPTRHLAMRPRQPIRDQLGYWLRPLSSYPIRQEMGDSSNSPA